MISAEVGTRLLQLGISIVLARLLGPSVFGTFGICLIFYRLFGAFGDLGFGAVIIQKDEITKKMIGSAVALSLLFSCIMGVGFYFFASYAYLYFTYDGLVDVLRACSFIFILEGLSIILRSIYIRNLRFKALSTVQLLTLATGSVISLLLAFQGVGIWSLVVGLYTEIGLQVMLLILLSHDAIKLRIDRPSIRDNYQYAMKILMARSIYYLNINMGAMVIGKFLGVYALGLYVVAYGLVDTPVQRISKSVGMVSFAALSKFQKNMQEFEKAYGIIKYYFSLIVFAAFIGLFIISQEFVATFYGSGWEDMVIPLRVLCFVGIFRALLVISSASLLALNKVEIELAIAFGQSVIMLILLVLFMQYGITGACLAVACAHGFGYIASLHFLGLEIKQKRAESFSHLYRAVVPSAVMLFVWVLSKLVFDDRITDLSTLIINILACGTCFVFSVLWMDRSFITKMSKFIFA